MYQRKGSKGLSRKRSLRQQFKYYRNRVIERLAYEQAFKEARGAGTTEGKIATLFKHQTYDELFERGITRKVKGVTVRYKGEEAIRIKIESYRRRASKSRLADQYIKNYIQAMKKKGYDWYDRYQVEKMLSALSVDRLTYLINESKPRGLPSIEYIYEEDTHTIVEQVENVINLSKSIEGKKDLKRIKERAKRLKKLELEKMRILEEDLI